MHRNTEAELKSELLLRREEFIQKALFIETIKFYNSKLKKPPFLHFYPPSSVICKRWRIHCNISLPVKQRKRQVLEIRSVPKSMVENETSPVLTPHCALDPTKCTDPFLQTCFHTHHTREAEIKCTAGLSPVTLSLRLSPDQAGISPWQREPEAGSDLRMGQHECAEAHMV